MDNQKNEVKLNRTMTPGQMEMIAIGGTIGSGLFMGATSTIKWTGPSVLLAYAFVGLVLYGVMRALGEMIYISPGTGSFADYGSKYIHPLAGYLTKWSNVFQFIIVGISDIIAMSQYLNYWWPNLPDWISGLVMIIILTLANLASAKAYGRLEFWFAMIKVVTIIVMIILGLLVIVLGLGNNWHPVGISNLWSHGGFFTGGFMGFMFSLSVIAGSYQGIELLGITAGEAASPRHAIVKSVKSVIWRILIFYIGAIFVIVSIYPWDELKAVGSPFVETFTKVGITGAAGIINFVVLTAAMSATNSAIFSTSRSLYSLARSGNAPKRFGELSAKAVPNNALTFSSLILFITVILNYIMPAGIFDVIAGISTITFVFTWIIILAAHIKYRQKNPQGVSYFKMPGYPITSWLTIIFFLAVLVILLFIDSTRIPLILSIVIFIALAWGYNLKKTDK